MSRSGLRSESVLSDPVVSRSHDPARGRVRSASTPSGISLLLMNFWMSASDPGAGSRGADVLMSEVARCRHRHQYNHLTSDARGGMLSPVNHVGWLLKRRT